MRIKRNLSNAADSSEPDLEKGSATRESDGESTAEKGSIAGEEPQVENKSEEEQPTDDTDDDYDHNDKVWKLFLESVAPATKSKVKIWQTELDAVLVFTGLFAGVVSAFLVDLRSHLQPDPQLIALKQIASILRNDTGLLELEHPSPAVITVATLWYSSLVITLSSALCGVLAKGWLGEILRELPLSDADQALGRWKRDKTAKNWQMDDVLMAVPLLTQLALAMFLSGFVVQSLGDNHDVGLIVLVFVVLGSLAYGMFTILPYFRPDCPYRTPLSNLISPSFLRLMVPDFFNHDGTGTEDRIQILLSRLSRESNDEIFYAAASTLAMKLESHDSKPWHRSLEKRASQIADALFLRLKSLTHKIRRVTGPSASIMQHIASSGTNGKDILETAFQHATACLHVLVKMAEHSEASYAGTLHPWNNQDIDRRWRSLSILPETCRLLATSLHITSLVAKGIDYNRDEIATIDWENMIYPIYESDPNLRTTLGTNACRGLLRGKENLRQVCALGLAMFMEVEAATTPKDPLKQISKKDVDDKVVDNGKMIIKGLWSELVKGWKKAVVQLLGQTEEDDENSVVKLLDHELYQSDIKASISGPILTHLASTNWVARKEAIRMLTKLVEHNEFKDAVETCGAIAKVICMVEDIDAYVRTAAIKALSTFSEHCSGVFTGMMRSERGITKLITMLADEDANVRVVAIEALLEFSKYDSYKPDFESSIPAIIKHLDTNNARMREQTIEALIHLSEIAWFQQVLEREGMIPKVVTMLEDDVSDVQAAAIRAVLTFRFDELTQNDIKSSIPAIIRQLDNANWHIREKTVNILVKLSECEIFQETLNINGIIPKIVVKLEDDNSVVRDAAGIAIREFGTLYESYVSDIKLSIPTIIKQLDHDLWATRQNAIGILEIFSQNDHFQETMNINGVTTKFISKLEDYDEDVRAAAIQALLELGTHSYFKGAIDYEHVPSHLFGKLSDISGKVRSSASEAVSRLITDEVYGKEMGSLISMSSLVKQLQDDSWSARQQAIEIFAQFAGNLDFQIAMNSEETTPMLASMLTLANDHDEGVRTAAIKALSVFGRQGSFQQTLQPEKIIMMLTSKLSDPHNNVRSAAQSTILALSFEALYKNDIKSAIPSIINYFEDTNSTTRQQAIKMLAALSWNFAFRDVIEMEMTVAKLVAKLEDAEADVRTAAAKALSVFAETNLFHERMRVERVIPKLIGKLGSDDKEIHSAVYNALVALGMHDDFPELLQEVVSTLLTVERPMRMEVYKLLTSLRDQWNQWGHDTFLRVIDTAICALLTQMTKKDLNYICRSISILAETAEEGLTGDDLRVPNSANKSARDAVEAAVKSKLVYKQDSRRYDVILALSQLAKHDVFLSCIQDVIPGLIEAVNNSNRNIWNLAFGAISALSRDNKCRASLVPHIQKLIQELIGWHENDRYPLVLIEAMLTLVDYREFQLKLKQVVSALMNQLPTDSQVVHKDAIDFYKATCRLISKICKIEDVGRELVPKLTCMLPNMGSSLTEELFELLGNVIEYGHLTVNDRIALASSLRIVSPASTPLAVKVCKLNMAVLLNNCHDLDFPSTDCIPFLNPVLGSDIAAVKSLVLKVEPDKVEHDKLKGMVENVLRNTGKYLPFA